MTFISRRSRLLVSIACAAAATVARAADPASDQTVTVFDQKPSNTNIFNFNYGPTASPALNLLGLAPSKVSLANGVEPFLLSVPNVFSGSSGSAIGLDLSPAWALQSYFPITVGKYENADYFTRAWYRSHLGFAATNGTASTDATKIQQSALALGLSTSLLSFSDPILVSTTSGGRPYYEVCIDAVIPELHKADIEIRDDFNQKLHTLDDLDSHLKLLVDVNTGKLSLPPDRSLVLETLRSYKQLFPAAKVPADLAASPARSAPTAVQAMVALRDLLAEAAQDKTASPSVIRDAQQNLQKLDGIYAIFLPNQSLTSGSESAINQKVSEIQIYTEGLSSGPEANFYKMMMQSPAFAKVMADLPATRTQPGATDADIAYLNQNFNMIASAVSAELTKQKAAFRQAQAVGVFTEAGLPKKLTDCATGAAFLAAAAPDVSVGAGYVEAGKPGTIGHLASGGETIWVAGRIPVYSNLQKQTASDLATGKGTYLLLGGSLNYTNQASVTTGKAFKPIISADQFGAWLGLEGYSSLFRGSLEGGYTRTTATDSVNDALSTSGWRWMASGSVKVTSSAWLGLSYGTADGSTSKLDDHTLLVTINFSTPSAEGIFGTSKSSGSAGSE